MDFKLHSPTPKNFLKRPGQSPGRELIVTHNPYGWRLGDWSQWVGAKNDGVV
jgi:hypothetical protein